MSKWVTREVEQSKCINIYSYVRVSVHLSVVTLYLMLKRVYARQQLVKLSTGNYTSV